MNECLQRTKNVTLFSPGLLETFLDIGSIAFVTRRKVGGAASLSPTREWQAATDGENASLRDTTGFQRGDLKPGFTNHIFCGATMAGWQRLAFVQGRIALAAAVVVTTNHRHRCRWIGFSSTIPRRLRDGAKLDIACEVTTEFPRRIRGSWFVLARSLLLSFSISQARMFMTRELNAR